MRDRSRPFRLRVSDASTYGTGWTLPRGRTSKTGTHIHVVNYRHVIHSLKKKPMALMNLVYRNALFPREAYRRYFEAALERLSERAACRLAVALLALAHEGNCEAGLAAALDRDLKAGRLPAIDDLEARFAPDPGKMPRIDVARHRLAGYGALLGAGGAGELASPSGPERQSPAPSNERWRRPPSPPRSAAANPETPASSRDSTSCGTRPNRQFAHHEAESCSSPDRSRSC